MKKEDAISRQAAIDAIISIDIYDLVASQAYYKQKRIEKLKNLPSVQPKAKTGHWINAKVGKLFPSNDFKCSECGNILNFDGVNCGRGDANYCPNCGAKMEREEEE